MPPVGWANTFRLEEEIGDRMNYLVSIADKFEIEILEVGIEKIKLNTKGYLASQVRGSYIEYDFILVFLTTQLLYKLYKFS